MKSDSGSRTFQFTYHFEISDIPQAAEQITAWIPYPPSTDIQTVSRFALRPDVSYEFIMDPLYGNRFIRLDLTGMVPKSGTKPVSVEATWTVTRHAVNRMPGTGSRTGICGLDGQIRQRYLAADVLVPVDGIISEEALKVTKGAEEPLMRARLLYDHIVKTVNYDKSGEGWGFGDAVYACNYRKGNCTDFHSLFIGEARALGIPARFIMGVPISETSHQGEIPGYHCWAEFYVDDYGWIPVDASEARKHPEKKERYFGGLDENRVQFTVGRDIRIPGTAAAQPFNYLIYPYVEIDGAVHDQVDKVFTFQDVS